MSTKTFAFAFALIALLSMSAQAQMFGAWDNVHPTTTYNYNYNYNVGGGRTITYVNTGANIVMNAAGLVLNHKQVMAREETQRQQTEANKQAQLAQTASQSGWCGVNTSGRNNTTSVNVARNADGTPCLTLTPWERESIVREQEQTRRELAREQAETERARIQAGVQYAQINAQYRSQPYRDNPTWRPEDHPEVKTRPWPADVK